jgi:hypothetical protein
MLPEVPHFFHISYTKKKYFSRDPKSQRNSEAQVLQVG